VRASTSRAWIGVSVSNCCVTRTRPLAEGRGANRRPREQLDAACAKRGIRVHHPELHLCTDNGAMIVMAAAMRLQAGMRWRPRSTLST